MDDRKQCGGIFQGWSTYTAFPVQLTWYSKVGFQADWSFCLVSRVLSVWLDGLEVDGSRGIGKNHFSILVRFWYCSTGMLCLLLTVEMSVKFKVKRRRNWSSFEAKIWKHLNPQWNEAKDSECSGSRQNGERKWEKQKWRWRKDSCGVEAEDVH